MTANMSNPNPTDRLPDLEQSCVLELRYLPTSCSIVDAAPRSLTAALRLCLWLAQSLLYSKQYVVFFMWCPSSAYLCCHCSSVPCRRGQGAQYSQAVTWETPQAQQRQSCVHLTSRAALLQEQQAALAGGEQEGSSTTGWSCDAGSMQRLPGRSVQPRSNSSGEPSAAIAARCQFEWFILMAALTAWLLLGLLADAGINAHNLASNCRSCHSALAWNCLYAMRVPAAQLHCLLLSMCPAGPIVLGSCLTSVESHQAPSGARLQHLQRSDLLSPAGYSLLCWPAAWLLQLMQAAAARSAAADWLQEHVRRCR
jgi:hypothetical protein